jgi:hypothetical protein
MTGPDIIEQLEQRLTSGPGGSDAPCSMFGTSSDSWAPVAARLAVAYAASDGRATVTDAELDGAAAAVVNCSGPRAAVELLADVWDSFPGWMPAEPELWSVHYSFPGCLPEGDGPELFGCWDDAADDMRDRLDQYLSEQTDRGPGDIDRDEYARLMSLCDFVTDDLGCELTRDDGLTVELLNGLSLTLERVSG